MCELDLFIYLTVLKEAKLIMCIQPGNVFLLSSPPHGSPYNTYLYLLPVELADCQLP